jgi:hypothetical protein
VFVCVASATYAIILALLQLSIFPSPACHGRANRYSGELLRVFTLALNIISLVAAGKNSICPKF